jgi:hypothetical protein
VTKGLTALAAETLIRRQSAYHLSRLQYL